MKESEVELEKRKAKTYLLDLFSEDIAAGKPPVVYTVLKHVSRSGMLRKIDAFYIKDNVPVTLNFYIEKLGLFKRHKNNDDIVVHGCGMDVGFEVVYTLSSVLYRDGFICLGERCRSNAHANGDHSRSRDVSHRHDSGGYLLVQKWQ